MKLSIKMQATIFVALSLILILSCILFLNNNSQTNSMESMYHANAETLKFALSKNIETIMLSGENEKIQPLVDQFKQKNMIEEISVVNSEKVVTISTHANNINNKSLDSEWTNVFSSGSDITLEQDINGTPMIITYKAYLNEGSCTDCHDAATEKILGGIKVVKSKKEMVDAISASTQNAILLGFLGILLLITGIVYFLNRKVFKPIGDVQEKLQKASSGEINQAIEIKSDDEIGKLLQSIKNLIEYIKELSQVSQKIADGNLLVEIEPKSENDVLGKSFKTMVFSLNEIIQKISDNTLQLASASNKITQAANESSSGALEQNNEIGGIVSAIEQINATIVESSTNTNEASQMAQSASGFATEGRLVVDQTIEGMKKISIVVQETAQNISKLETSAIQIGEIINVIDDIADQTNLLALNAAIEAARAGEQGRGFAVVADEVRKLAERTGKATGEISAMIKEIQTQTNSAVRAMETGIEEVNTGQTLADKAGDSLSQIVEVTNQVKQMIEQVSASSAEHANATEEIAKSIEHINLVSKRTKVSFDNAAFSAEQLNEQADMMKDIVQQFELKGGELSMFKVAKNDHTFYMNKLKSIIEGIHDPALWVFTTNQQCAFGKWYYGNAQSQFGTLGKFKEVEQPHFDVHSFANDAVKAYIEKDFSRANDLYKKAEMASRGVISCCDAVYNEAIELMK